MLTNYLKHLFLTRNLMMSGGPNRTATVNGLGKWKIVAVSRTGGVADPRRCGRLWGFLNHRQKPARLMVQTRSPAGTAVPGLGSCRPQFQRQWPW